MRDIASNYARAYQAKLVTSGHLFERRYHAKLVDIDAYLFALLRYIHLNPVKDRLVPDVGSYPWSSHRAYAGLVAPEPWLEIDFCLAVFAEERRKAQAAYRRFIDQSDPMREDVELHDDRCVLGDDKFMANLSKSTVTPGARQTLAELVTEGCARFGVPLSTLQSVCRDPQSVRARGWIARQAKERRVATLSDVARLLGRDRATLRYSMRVQAERK
jgi:putative transposase